MGTKEEPNVTKTENLCEDSSVNTEPETDASNPKQENEETLGGPKFVPQLYLQRYSKVAQIVEEFDVKKVVDFGCAECSFQKYLRNIETVEEVSCVDVDGELVRRVKHKTSPQTSDYVFKRSNPLVVKLFEGDVSQFDCRLADYEAVTMVELVEHLEQDVLESFPAVVFGMINPKVAIVTTPNSEFNVLFPNFTGFRHPDHKFEWTRAQFQEWCDSVASRFGYKVTCDGVGDATPGDEHVGFCTQIAKFVRISEHKTLCGDTSTPYDLISEHVFPHQTEVLSSSQEVLLEAEYYMRMLARDMEEDDAEEPEETYYVEIELDRLMKYKRLSGVCDNDVNKLKETLGNHGYDFSPDGTSVRYPKEVYHSDYSGLSAEEDNDKNSNHDDCGHGNQVTDSGDCCHSNSDPSNGFVYIPGQFSDAEDDDSVPCLTFQYGKKTPSRTMWSYPSHTASDDVDWD